MELYSVQCAQWFESQVRRHEANDPVLRQLKQEVNAASEAVLVAQDLTHDAANLIKAQNRAIAALMRHIANKLHE